MKFEFQFASLLNIRRYGEKKEQQKLGRLQKEKFRLLQNIASLKRRLQTYETTVSDGDQKASDIRHRYEMKQDMRKKIWQLHQNVNRLEEAIEHQRVRLVEANRQTQMLEKLESREKARFIEEYQRQEQEQQNEIATQIFNRS